MKARIIATLVRSASLGAVTLGFGTTPVSAANLTRSIEVNGTPAAVWTVIGSFCAIKDWLPPVGTCADDIAPLFPAYTNITGGSGAIGAFEIDTTTLPNGMHTIGWSLRSLDTAARNPDKLMHKLLSQVKGGDIILLHDSVAHTASILTAFIHACREKGFTFVRLDKMLGLEAYA